MANRRRTLVDKAPHRVLLLKSNHVRLFANSQGDLFFAPRARPAEVTDRSIGAHISASNTAAVPDLPIQIFRADEQNFFHGK